MPKLDEMAQLSRPFQIVLVAVCLLAGVWLFALQGGSSSTSGSATSPAAPASSPTTQSGSSSAGAAEAKAAAPTPIYHGSAPGVEGLTRAIAKAHGVVATSQQNAKQLEEKSAQASGTSASASGSSGASTSSQPATPVTHASSSATRTAQAPAPTASAPAAARASTKQQSIKAPTGTGRTAARQVLVERALKEGKVAVILFWNPKGFDDDVVRQELLLLEAIHHLIHPLARVPQVRRALERSGLELEKKFAAFQATASQVASFGSITRGVQVYGTPTLLVINKRGQTITLTGVQDAFSIEQAIDEARNS